MVSDLVAQVESRSFGVVLRLQGDAGATNAVTLDRQVRELIARGRGLVVVDLAGVSFISSTAIGLLAYLQREFEAIGGKVYIVNPSPLVREVIERCRIGDLLPMMDSVAVSLE